MNFKIILFATFKMLSNLTFFLFALLILIGIYTNTTKEHHMNCPYYKMRYNPYHCPYCRRLKFTY